MVALDLDQPVGFYLDVLAGVAFLALAVVVGLVRPRRPVNLAFAFYAVGLALATIAANVVDASGGSDLLRGEVFVAGVGVGGVALVAVAVLLDRTVSQRAPMRLWPLLAASLALYVVYWIGLGQVFGLPRGPLGPILRYELFGLLYFVAYVGVWVLLTFVLLAARRQAWRMPVKVAALLTLGIATWPGFAAGNSFGLNAASSAAVAGLQLLWVLPFLAIGAAWIADAARLGRPALAAGLGLFAAPAAGSLMALVPTGSRLESFFLNGGYGVVTFTGLALLAYALLRHQMFDIDIKVKWTLRRGSVAFVFLAVFFVAAQLAQNYLSDRYGWALGGITAGLLLFAIAPIQKAAERLSDKALPGVDEADPAYVLSRKRETYRNALAAAWSDGTLTAKDQRLLAEFKDALGLPHDEYAAIERAHLESASR